MHAEQLARPLWCYTVEIDAIRDLWATGQAQRAGWVIYEATPNKCRASWAADILELACSRVPTVPAQIQTVIAIARDAKRWQEAHAAFSAVRDLTLVEERSHAGGRVYESLLFVAENVAKVVYNASGEPAPFDDDCGAWLVGCLRHLVDTIGSVEWEQRAWGLLESWLRRTPAAQRGTDRSH
jgi:hypothetical protein